MKEWIIKHPFQIYIFKTHTHTHTSLQDERNPTEQMFWLKDKIQRIFNMSQ